MDQDSSSSSTLSLLQRLTRTREEFEAEWRAGRRPVIEEWLERAPSDDRPDLLRVLVAAEIQLRSEHGETLSPREYLRRFPADGSTIALAFQPTESAGWSLGLTGLNPSDAPTGEYPRQSDSLATSVEPSPPGSHVTEPDVGGPPPASPSKPRYFGRYRVVGRLGAGAFGRVYLASDEMLNRTVAIKAPSPALFRSSRQVRMFLDEARMAAKLNHPAIVGVYDVGRQDDGTIYIVLEYVEGEPLSRMLEAGTLSVDRLAGLLAGVSEAVHHAHEKGLVHRDLKPGNIVVDTNGNPHVADFGLALHVDVQHRHCGEIAGTATYMAPEQVRGEAHRLDGRTDVWALGIILYRALCGRTPFSGDTEEVFDAILHHDPRPVRQVNDAIPRELERICLKCLSKRMSDRYESAFDLAGDLRQWLAGAHGAAASSESVSIQVACKGLRSFEEDDADGFVSLLPGPRGRDGLPESIRFWKSRIETSAADSAFSVGLIYGPTGCGKSSFVKAGLLPRLDSAVRTIYVESSAQGTEAKLLAALRREYPDVAIDHGLDLAAAAIRERRRPAGDKLLIVLDQFEQWLHHHADGRDSQLLRALRQCDGDALSALVLVRDDFWMAVTRFMRALEVPLVEGQNCAAVELLDASHARKVLTRFGYAFGKLPDGANGPDASRFMDEAVSGLAGPDGRVIPVRLILFAEMVRNRPWVPETLRSLGGIEGIGVMFLDETFGERSAPLAYRLHRASVLAVLRALLPEPPSDLKGAQQSRSALQEAAGYADRPADFDQLLHILDNELRMVTPVDADVPDGAPSGPDDPPAEAHYQLTHDYLVSPLRQWLTRKQRETRAGRAELRLAERTARWTSTPERRQLPTSWEWLAIRAFTSPAGWTPTQRTMMRAATRYYVQTAAALLASLFIGIAALAFERRHAAHGLAQARVQEQVRQLWNVDFGYLPALLDRLDEHPDLSQALVSEHLRRPSTRAAERVRGELALARRGAADLNYLSARLLDAHGPEHATLRTELRPSKARLVPGLWSVLADAHAPGSRRLAAAAALVDYEPTGPGWAAAARPIVRDLIAQNPLLATDWVQDLLPVRAVLRDALVQAFSDPTVDEAQKSLAASILADYGAADERYLSDDLLAELVLDANRAQSSMLMPLINRQRAKMVGRLERALAKAIPLIPDDGHRREVDRHANAAETLLRLGRADAFWPMLKQSEDPRLRTRLIDRGAPGLASWQQLSARLAAEKDGTVRQAILLSLAESHGAPDALDRLAVDEGLLAIHKADPDPGVHSAAEWMLNRRGLGEKITATKRALAGEPPNGKRWFITSQLQTMIVIPAPVTFLMGSPGHEAWHESNEPLREVTIDHPFAISAQEVSIENFKAFRDDVRFDEKIQQNVQCAVAFVSWFDAAMYCRWLSEQDEEKIPEAQRCYPPVDEINKDMTLSADHLSRQGYRLPTEAEWEYAARAGALTRWFFGDSVASLDFYAWSGRNSEEHIRPGGQLRPNPLGLFDVYGNVEEWCDVVRLPSSIVKRSFRGGSYRSGPRYLRSAWTAGAEADKSVSVQGFRIVRILPRPATDD